MSFIPPYQETAAILAARNPLVPRGIIASETDTGVVKIGDGVTRYNSLSTALNTIYAAFDRGGRVPAVRNRRLSILPAPAVAAAAGVMTSEGTSGSATGYTSRQPFKAAIACTDLQLVYPLGYFLTSGAQEQGATQSNPIKVAVEVAGGTIYPVTFKGSRLITIDAYGFAVTDPIAIDLAVGDVFYVRQWMNIGSGAKYMNGTFTGGPGITTTGTIGYAAGDQVDSGSITSADSSGSFWAPIVCGQPLGTPAAQLAIVGDSIEVGTGGAAGGGWWRYGVNNTLPALMYAKSGARAQYIAAGHFRGFPILQGCTHAIVKLGTNDILGSRTIVQAEADLTTIYSNLISRGMRVYGVTIPPNTTSSDSWATTGNQTVATGFEAGASSVRGQLNAWIRAGGGGLLTSYIEASDPCETSRNSGLWKVSGSANYATADGTHPSTAFHQLMGAALDPTLFTV